MVKDILVIVSLILEGGNWMKKELAQIFTPLWIVKKIIKLLKIDKDMLEKSIIDPQCGDGNFLKEIVRMIIQKKLPKNIVKDYLENNLYGIEIDNDLYKKCIQELNELIKGLGISINWKIFNGDTLKIYKTLNKKFDYVIGNPPYIRLHHLDKEMRMYIKDNFIFKNGTIDIYLTFFEIGIYLLNENGKLGYITPNSYFHNTSYKHFRKFLKENELVEYLIDFKSRKVFDGIYTYTQITILNKDKKDYLTYEDDSKIEKFRFNDLDNKNWFFNKEINLDRKKKVSDFFNVQYGFATLRDKIYISDIKKQDDYVLFNGSYIEKTLLFKIIKGINDKNKYILFPYKRLNGKFIIIPENELIELYPKTYQYFLKHKEELLKRDIRGNTLWYEFGRSQGIRNIHNEKIIINNMINNKIYYTKVDKNIFVYSGIFITKKDQKTNWSIMENVLKSDEFLSYSRSIGKDFSGGYKSITSKQIQDFTFN